MSDKTPTPISVCWLRRDLRLNDQAALYHALRGRHPVLCLFIFDTTILDGLPPADRRVFFIHKTLADLKQQLRAHGSDLCVKYGTPEQAWEELLDEHDVVSVYTNRDYEPYAVARDRRMADYFSAHGIGFHTYKDQVIFEPGEILKPDGTPYTVFTPFFNKWLEKLNPFYLKPSPLSKYHGPFLQAAGLPFPGLKDFGFSGGEFSFPGKQAADNVLMTYAQTRDLPGLENGTSHLGVHLRFGTVGIRELASRATTLSAVFLKELAWREFFMHLLYHFPETGSRCFRPAYENIRWRNDENEFEKWCRGQTGYPVVDAGMRELNATGYMHNRVRMITASFLCKHLLVDWRWGERYFASTLSDFDLAANVGNWQWAAGCGCDAAPYFRIFNPETQAQKFDPQGSYIRKWVPEWGTPAYPPPIVDHKEARERALQVYAEGLKG